MSAMWGRKILCIKIYSAITKSARLERLNSRGTIFLISTQEPESIVDQLVNFVDVLLAVNLPFVINFLVSPPPITIYLNY
jgi:hypothetical protein